jgi:FkbM family methyltransferase
MDGVEERLRHALAAVRPAAASPRVWLDVGTSFKSLAKFDVLHNMSLVVVGIDPVRANIEHALQPRTPRFVGVHGACAEGPASFAMLNVHRSPTCASLHNTRARGPVVGAGKDACTGDVPVPTRVPTFPLRQLIRRMQRHLAPRIELLKIDVQGAELTCLRSAGSSLKGVDNVLLEVQDAEEGSPLLMYENSPTLLELDTLLAAHGLVRQYCELNAMSIKLREVNCLYSSVALSARRLWATGNFQFMHSMVSYARLPYFGHRQMRIANPLRTSTYPGERIWFDGQRGRPPWSTHAPWLRPLDSFNTSAARGPAPER